MLDFDLWDNQIAYHLDFQPNIIIQRLSYECSLMGIGRYSLTLTKNINSIIEELIKILILWYKKNLNENSP